MGLDSSMAKKTAPSSMVPSTRSDQDAEEQKADKNTKVNKPVPLVPIEVDLSRLSNDDHNVEP